MSKGIIYFLHGTSHTARLLVSLVSLRRWYDGPVCLLATDQGGVCKQICNDQRLRVVSRPIQLADVKRNACYTTMAQFHRWTPYETNLYIDADTLVVGDFAPLWPVDGELTLCQFAQWTTTGKIMRDRIEKWRAVVPVLVEHSLSEPRPAVNCGIWGFGRDAWYMKEWEKLTLSNYKTFIPNEIAGQIAYLYWPHRLLDCRYNCSPAHSPDTKDVRIWHGHGDKHLRGPMRQPWLDTLSECLHKDYGGCGSWLPGLLKEAEYAALGDGR